MEPVNEPEYLSREKLDGNPRMQRAYQDWLREAARKDDANAFGAVRYETTLAYLNGIVGVIRAAGAKQPLVWNCGWPRNIQHNEEVFRAITDSEIAVKSCVPVSRSADNGKPYVAIVSKKAH